MRKNNHVTSVNLWEQALQVFPPKENLSEFVNKQILSTYGSLEYLQERRAQLKKELEFIDENISRAQVNKMISMLNEKERKHIHIEAYRQGPSILKNLEKEYSFFQAGTNSDLPFHVFEAAMKQELEKVSW